MKQNNMETEFDSRGLAILRNLMPHCLFEKNNNTLVAMQNNKRVYCEVDFEELFKLIDDDRLLRQVDSSEWYWTQLGKIIEQGLK